ncbi:hypothetical protein CSKR_100225 [Clonorchis sinensis]|uniref:Transcription factor A mitochondrial n=2 Tax=Clonorchis sinensis TaxID=79923 RepID=H2KTW7_CLOSI|nr:hypothetical protein CSKR_100225 [Clonorchis sinensis]GAA27387.2 transcription factor A mitochondrial [Clonorchis sinensis]
MFALSCPSLRKAVFDTMTLSRALLSTSPTLATQNTFHQFVKARYMEVKQKNPSLKAAELMRKMGEEYRKLTDAERVQFKLSEPTPDLIRRHSEKRKRLMYAHKHGMPRRPSFSGMNIFIREKLCDMKGQPIRKVNARFKEAVEEWKKLSSTEKADYSKKAQDVKDAYEKELVAWASEHDVRFTKNLSLLTSRFYQHHENQKRTGTKPSNAIHSASSRRPTEKQPSL